MEKIKIGSMQFELVPNGVDDTSENQLVLRFQLPGTLDEVETLLTDPSNTQRIEVLESGGSLQRPLTGYVHLVKISKIRDYLIETVTEPGTEGEENVVLKEVRADIAEAVLAREDIRAKVEQNTADIAYLSMMTDVSLEG